MKYKKLLIAAFLVFVIASGVFSKLSAQKVTPGLQVHPSNFDFEITPGKTITQTVYLENRTKDSVPIRVDLRNFTALGEEGSVNLTSDDTAYSLAKWISITPQTVAIKPNESQKFTFKINVPANAEPGGHYGSIVFTTVPDKNINSTGAKLSQEVASLILARVPGNAEEKAVTESFNSEKNFYEFGPVMFDARVKNEGAVHIQPFGTVHVTGPLGQSFDAKIENLNVLPNAVRKIPATLKNKILIGKFTARFIAVYGSKNQQLYATTEFYAFPVRYSLIVLAVIVLLILLRKRLRKAFRALVTGK